MFFCCAVAAMEKTDKRKNTDGSVIFIGGNWREKAKNRMARSALVSSSA
jgi:hypothetical protein